MGRIIRSHDDLPVREYRDFLLKFNNLLDCSWFWCDEHESRDRFENWELELLRNQRGGVIEIEGDGKDVVRVRRSHFKPTQTRLRDHREQMKKKQAVWLTNGAGHDTLMLLIDFDKKKPETDCEGAARHVVEKYLSGRGYVERSTGGTGLHVYFFVDLKYVKRDRFCAAMKVFFKTLAQDDVLARLNQSFDAVPVYGLPTLWGKDRVDQWQVTCRGNQLKAPFLPRGRADFEALRLLSERPLSGQKIVRWADEARKGNTAPSAPLSPLTTRRVAQPPNDSLKPSNGSSGASRRGKLYAQMKRANPDVTEDEFVQAYEIRTPHNGGEEKVRKHFRHMEATFVVNKKSKAIDLTKYLDVVRATITSPLALHTPKGRTNLTHERVAQFVAVKMHDAQQAGVHQAASSRETLVNFWASLKEQGRVDWTMTANAYASLVKLCTRHGLLEIIEDYTAPIAPGARNGRCRRIGPGPALGDEYHRFEFTRQRLLDESVRQPVSSLAI